MLSPSENELQNNNSFHNYTTKSDKYQSFATKTQCIRYFALILLKGIVIMSEIWYN